MSRQYFDDPYGPSRRRVTIQSYQPSDGSSRRNVPSTAQNSAFQSTFQPNRETNFVPPPPPHHHYRGEYSHSDGYPNSARSSSNRMTVSQRFLSTKKIFNIFNIRINRMIDHIHDID